VKLVLCSADGPGNKSRISPSGENHFGENKRENKMKNQIGVRLHTRRSTWALPLVLATALYHSHNAQAVVVVGNIDPLNIEIDQPSANLYPSNNVGYVDWVKDSLTNSDPATVTNSIASGIIPGLTGAAGGKGHWYGVRIVDRVDGSDQDIFLNGGKENLTNTWNIGPGSVGSSKYDISQAYLANNIQKLFFGMERRGNNGSTAFDFEFNQLPPFTTYIPNRSIGDVLFTFEMQGSGGSGSATPHFFIWNGTKFEEQIPAPSSLVSSINQAEIPAAPWGYVDSKANWVLGNIPRFEFAEASVDLQQAFPNFVPCNTKAFIQVRTRASAGDTSDLKDTTKYFEFSFGGPVANAALTGSCAPQFFYDASQSINSSGGTNVNLGYLWSFTPPAGITLNGTGIVGPDSNGTYFSTLTNGTVAADLGNAASATIGVRLMSTESSTCTNQTGTINITVANALTAVITNKEMNGALLTVTMAGSSPGATGLQWQRYDGTNWLNIAGATASSLAYSNFQNDSTATIINFDIGIDPYQGQLYQVMLRLLATRTNAGVCNATSAPVTLKKIIGVDP
jgi:hypothetical protein